MRETEEAAANFWQRQPRSRQRVLLVLGGCILVASVTERTREIGIRRALGAKRRQIIRPWPWASSSGFTPPRAPPPSTPSSPSVMSNPHPAKPGHGRPCQFGIDDGPINR